MENSREQDEKAGFSIEVVEKEISVSEKETSNTGSEVIEDWNAWLHVLAGFVTYMNTS